MLENVIGPVIVILNNGIVRRSRNVEKSHEEQEALRVAEELARERKKKKIKYGEREPDIAVEYCFLQLATLEDADGEKPRQPEVESPRDGVFKFEGRSLRLNNNQLTDIQTLPAFVKKTFIHPDKLAWIDLSFNALTIVDAVLLEFQNLQILYLHGNKIVNLKELDKLAGLPKLHKLTLHGNPLEEDKDYKMYVACTLPRLTNISFSAVTKCQASSAVFWKRMTNLPKKKKNKRDDD
ncbi:hypothetical protein ACOMHN_036992 [Nucella lapillus]